MMDETSTPQTWGGKVDDVISQSLYGAMGEPVGSDGPSGAASDSVRSTVAALQVIERHLDPVTPAQLAGVALLRMQAAESGPDGEVFTQIADFWMETHHLRGSAGPLMTALENATLLRHFKGSSGSLVAGKGIGPGAKR